MEIVPNKTTVETAMALLCASALTTGSVASTAAAPQIEAPEAVKNEVCLSSLSGLIATNEPMKNVDTTIIQKKKWTK